MKRSTDIVDETEHGAGKQPHLSDDLHVDDLSVGSDKPIDDQQVLISVGSDQDMFITDDVDLEAVQGPTIVEDLTIVEEDDSISHDDLDQFGIPHTQIVQNIVVQHMNIAEPLTTLRRLLEAKLQCSLKEHDFYLQDQILLQPEKNLVEQCVQGEGTVQINVEIKSQPGIKPKINIVDILKQTEEIIETVEPPINSDPPPATNSKVVIPFHESSEHVTRWIVDQNFRKEQERLKIPLDPSSWNSSHVKHWLQWAVKEFSLSNVDLKNFALNGRQLTDLKHDEFTRLIPSDRNDIFWTHLELLRKCKFVAVVQQPTPHAITTVTVSTSAEPAVGKFMKPKYKSRPPRISDDRTLPGNRTGNNGQIQLWQFLLELLTDKECREIIHWVGDEGEFKLNHPELVAQMWGQRKNKPNMTYEKLSRALRYYYDGDMIAKVHGKRFVYKFICDLRLLLGYTAGELNRLVMESSERFLNRVRLGFPSGNGSARVSFKH